MEESFENKPLREILSDLMIQTVPAYANKFYYSLGFLSMTALLVLVLSGIIMVAFGPDWWLTNSLGIYVRSVHLWATQAFVLFVFLHLMIVFLTSGFKAPRQLTWVIGGLMLFLALGEAEFGYVLRGDFSSQWRALQGADLYNGSGLGIFLNNLNYAQIYGIHIILLPLLILSLLFVHYLLVRVRGIAKPYRKELIVPMVRANHKILFFRGAVLVGVVLILAHFFPSPLIIPTTIVTVAKDDPSLFEKTLVSEMDHSSDTATYMDNIDPYKFDTRKIYVLDPYLHLWAVQKGVNWEDKFLAETVGQKDQEISAAKDYFSQINTDKTTLMSNSAVQMVTALLPAAQSGLFEADLRADSASGLNLTYTTRFLADTGVLENQAKGLLMKTEQYGMLREEKGGLPGAWWLMPIGVLDHTVLLNDDNQDRDGAEIVGLFMLLFLAFPYIPYLNRIPEVLRVDRWIWK